jgi:hypothetical protein
MCLHLGSTSRLEETSDRVYDVSLLRFPGLPSGSLLVAHLDSIRFDLHA